MNATRRFLAALSFTTLVCGFAASTAHADTVKGRVASINAKDRTVRITGPNAHLDLSLEELLQDKRMRLNDLDVGQEVQLEVEKTSAGKWMIASLKRIKDPYTASKKKTKDPEWLKTEKEPTKPSGRKRSLESLPSPALQ
jgi:hypothetical protein